MSDTITPGNYTITFGRSRLSGKRFADAQKLVKDKLSGEYDPATRQWTVTVDGVLAASHLAALRDSYGCTIEAASEQDTDRAALAAERRQLVQRLAEIDRILDRTEIEE